MKKFILLAVLLFICGTLIGQLPDKLSESVNDKVKIKKDDFPKMVIKGYEENTLILSINHQLNSVESYEPVKEIISPYLKLSDFDISRVIKPEKLIKLEEKYIKEVLKDKDLDKLEEKVLKTLSLYKIKIKDKLKDKDLSLSDIEKKLKRSKDVTYVQKNYKYSTNFDPNDPGYSNGNQWGIESTQTNLAWDYSQGNGVIVATIDTGLDYNHPDILNNLWTDPLSGYCGYDFSDDDADPLDYSNHGTHMAGVIAAVMNNGLGIAGVAPQVQIMAVKVFPNAYSDVLAQGIIYAADNGADVINNSWGLQYRRPDDPVVNAAIDYAYASGCVVVNSAGNVNDDAQYYFGANHPDVICVAAVDSNLNKTSVSNFGSVVDIAAPGQYIYSLQPGGSYLSMSGTSPAAAFVSGLAALIKGYNPALSNSEIKNVIINSAATISDPSLSGIGFMNSYSALTGGILPTPPPIPNIINIPDVDEGEDIIIYAENITSESMVIIQGPGVHEYASILSIQTDNIVIENQYSYGTYQIQIENESLQSDPDSVTINYVPLSDAPSIGVIPDVEEENDLFIYGENFDPNALTVHISGNGFDENAQINFACHTAIQIENYYFAGDYQITIYNGPIVSNTLSFTIHNFGTLPQPVYNIINGDNGPFNYLPGTSAPDIINGYGGTDYLFGYGDNDILNGGDGSDVFIYGENHGIDTIEDSSGEDLILIMGIDPMDVTPGSNGSDYILYVPNGRILVRDQFVGPSSVIEEIQFW